MNKLIVKVVLQNIMYLLFIIVGAWGFVCFIEWELFPISPATWPDECRFFFAVFTLGLGCKTAFDIKEVRRKWK